MTHISWSQIGMLMRCQPQWYFRYVLGIIMPPGIAAGIGGATHKSVEKNLRHKMDTGDLLPVNDCMDIARDALIYRWDKNGVLVTADEKSKGIKVVKGEAIDVAVKLSALHSEKVAPDIEPADVECKWELDIVDTDYTLLGYIDIREDGGIRETKTIGASGATNQRAADTSDQITTYVMAESVLKDVKPETVGVQLDYLRKLKSPRHVSVATKRTQADVDSMLLRIETAIKIMERGIFMPCARDSWLCSADRCGYFHICEYGGKR